MIISLSFAPWLYACAPNDLQTKSNTESILKTHTQNATFSSACAVSLAKPPEVFVAAPQVPNAPINHPCAYNELLERAKKLTAENDALRIVLIRNQERLNDLNKQRQHYLVWATRALNIILKEEKAHLIKEEYSAAMDPADIPEWTNELLDAQLKKMWQERRKNGDDRYCYPADYCEEDDADQNK